VCLLIEAVKTLSERIEVIENNREQ